MIKMTSELGDGWVPESHTPETCKKTLKIIHKYMADFGRDIMEIEPCLATIFYPFEPDEKAYNRLLSAAKHYLATYPDILWAAGYGKDHPGLRTQNIVINQKLWDTLANRIPNKLADATIIYGDIEDCVDKISKFKEAGCTHLILEPYWIENKKVKMAINTIKTIMHKIN